MESKLEPRNNKKEQNQKKHNLFLEALREGNIKQAIEHRPLNHERAYTKEELYLNSNEHSQPPIARTLDFSLFKLDELTLETIKDKFTLCQSIANRLMNHHDRSKVSLFVEWQKPVYDKKLEELGEKINSFEEKDPKRQLLQEMYVFLKDNITAAKANGATESQYNTFYRQHYEAKEGNKLFEVTQDSSKMDKQFAGLTTNSSKRKTQDNPTNIFSLPFAPFSNVKHESISQKIENSKKKTKPVEKEVKPHSIFHILWIDTLLNGTHNPGRDLCFFPTTSTSASFFTSQSPPLEWGNLYIKKISSFYLTSYLYYSTLMLTPSGSMTEASGTIYQSQLPQWEGWDIEPFNVKTLIPFLPCIFEKLKTDHDLSYNLRCTLHLWPKNDDTPKEKGKLYIKISPPSLEYRYINFQNESSSGFLSMDELGCNSLKPDSTLSALTPYFLAICQKLYEQDKNFRPDFSPHCRDQLYKLPAPIIPIPYDSGINLESVPHYRPLEAAILGACKTGNLNQVFDILCKMKRHHSGSCLSVYFEFRYLHQPYPFAKVAKDIYGDLLKTLSSKCSEAELEPHWQHVKLVYDYIKPIIRDARLTPEVADFNKKYDLTLNAEEIDELKNIQNAKEKELFEYLKRHNIPEGEESWIIPKVEGAELTYT